jgi:hypothetical protein
MSFTLGSTDTKQISEWFSSLKTNLSKPSSNLELKGEEVAKMGLMMKAKKKHRWKSCYYHTRKIRDEQGHRCGNEKIVRLY